MNIYNLLEKQRGTKWCIQPGTSQDCYD